MNAVGRPVSSSPSRFTTLTAAKSAGWSFASARAPTKPNSSASGKITPTADSRGSWSSVMKIATRAVALSSAPGELSFTRFCDTIAPAIASTTTAGMTARNNPITPSTSIPNPINRIAMEIGWPLES